MKKVFLLSASFIFALLSSCSQEDNIGPNGNITSIPSAVLSAASTAYPNAVIEYGVISSSKFGASVQTNTGSATLVMNQSGQVVEKSTSIPQAELPEMVKAYLNANYAGYGFVAAYKKTTGKLGYRVEIDFQSERVSLFFDEAGALVAEFVGGRGKGGKGGPGRGRSEGTAHAATQITEADLPAAVKAAIAGYTFKSGVIIVRRDSVKVYHIHTEKDAAIVKFNLDENGNVVEKSAMGKHGAIVSTSPLSTLPQAITDYLNSKLGNTWTLKTAVSISKDSVKIHYHVVVNVGTGTQTFRFDQNFALITNDGKGPKDNPSLVNVSTTTLTKDQLNATILAYINGRFANWTFTSAQSISKDNVLYETEVYFSFAGKNYKIEFDANNKFHSLKVL